MIRQSDLENYRRLLVQLGKAVLAGFLKERALMSPADMSGIHDVTEADTIFAIDQKVEVIILEWFAQNWPSEVPLELIMEGLETRGRVTYPPNTPRDRIAVTCIIDPIDGTRNIMHDKRSGWMLIGLAPTIKALPNTLADIQVAVMTELPTTKQWRADQLSVIKGNPLQSESIDIFTGTHYPLTLQPSASKTLDHQFLSFAKFFPLGKTATSQLEDKLWEAVLDGAQSTLPILFDDQYISTGGQLYEIIAGHDLMIADIRPFIHKSLGYEQTLVCHPYDICTYPILEAAGGLIHFPGKSSNEIPLDTTTPVSWIAYANKDIEEKIHPKLITLLDE